VVAGVVSIAARRGDGARKMQKLSFACVLTREAGLVGEITGFLKNWSVTVRVSDEALKVISKGKGSWGRHVIGELNMMETTRGLKAVEVAEVGLEDNVPFLTAE
jgi:hypothetical protein